MGPRIPRGRGISTPSLGVDVGGTKVLAVLVDADQQVVDRALGKTRHGGPEAVVDQVAMLLAKLDPNRAIDAVGVGVPGVVIGSTVERAVNLAGWAEPVDLGSLLAGATNRHVVLRNDVAMALTAEHRCGKARGFSNVLGISVGTGVGGALILDGQQRDGRSGLAGEIGHTPVAANLLQPKEATSLSTPLCACGAEGHLEAYMGRASLERRVRALDEAGTASLLVDLAKERRMTSSMWIDALAAGDDVAHRLLDEATIALSMAITTAVTLLDLELVVLGGGFASRLGAQWRNRVAAYHDEAMGRIGPPAQIRGSGVGDNAAALGAALSSVEHR